MAVFELHAGGRMETTTPAELHQALVRQDERLRADLAGIKWRRLPRLFGTAVSGVLDIGGDSKAGWNGQPVGPASGFAWSIKLGTVAGLTTGATPDIVNLYIQGANSSVPWWQFNGNNFAYTFGKGDLVILSGESIRLASVGTFVATGTITLLGSVWQVPQEELGKLA